MTSDFVDGDPATPQLLSACQNHCVSSGSGVVVKVRQSASLVAGVCTLCVAASTTVTPVSAMAAATAETKSPVVRPFELTAASDVLVDGVNVAGLPLRNLITVLSRLAGVAGGSAGNGGNGAGSLQALPNLLYSQLVAGTLTPESANTAIGNALGIEQDALDNLAGTPGEIIATDIEVINTLLADLGLGSGFGSLGGALGGTTFKTAAVTSDVTAADVGVDPSLVNIANALSLPLQNLVTVLSRLAGVAGGSAGNGGNGAGSLQALPNLLYSQLVAGTLTPESANKAIGAALGIEQDALESLGATPGEIVAHDIEVLSALFGGSTTSMFTTNTNSVQPQLQSAAITQPDTGGTLVDAINVASLPLQNGITVLNALAGAAGGSAGNGGNGAGSLQALPNLLYSQLVAGTLTPESANKAITAAVTTEQAALTNLAATPGKIIATDLAAIQKLAGGSAASSLLPAKQQSNTPALTNTDVNVVASKIAGDEGAKDTPAGSTTRARHAAKATDNIPVSNAIKAIKDASKGSYVGRHRADTVGATGAAGSDKDDSKGSV
jgi:hypothetical protein